MNIQLWRNLRRSGFRQYDFGLWPSYSKLKSLKRSEWTSSHHRKMMFEGDWGCCSNKRMSKSSKQGPVYTACEFVNLYRFALLANLWTVKISLKLFPTLESFRCVTCGQFVHKLKSAFSFFELVTNLGTSYFIPDELAAILLSDNLSGSCGVTLDQLGPKRYVDIQIGKQWKVVPLSDFENPPLGHFAKMLAREASLEPLE